MQDKLESLESVVRMLELKVKNSADHGNVFILVILTEYNLNSKMERSVIKFWYYLILFYIILLFSVQNGRKRSRFKKGIHKTTWKIYRGKIGNYLKKYSNKLRFTTQISSTWIIVFLDWIMLLFYMEIFKLIFSYSEHIWTTWRELKSWWGLTEWKSQTVLVLSKLSPQPTSIM